MPQYTFCSSKCTLSCIMCKCNWSWTLVNSANFTRRWKFRVGYWGRKCLWIWFWCLNTVYFKLQTMQACRVGGSQGHFKWVSVRGKHTGWGAANPASLKVQGTGKDLRLDLEDMGLVFLPTDALHHYQMEPELNQLKTNRLDSSPILEPVLEPHLLSDSPKAPVTIHLKCRC